MAPAKAETTYDATKISFPLQLVIMGAVTIVTTMLSVTGTLWATQKDNDKQNQQLHTEIAQVQADMRVMLEKAESAAQINKLRDDARNTNDEALKADVTDLRRQQQLMQIQMQNLQLELAKGKR